MAIRTRVLILSDTHGMRLQNQLPEESIDVAIHCGDLTDGSKLEEFRNTYQLLRALNAPLKLVIPGNHDFTMDTSVFKRKITEAGLDGELDLVRREYGTWGEAKTIIDVQDEGIHLLHEGTHTFKLQNGALLNVYASPLTPSEGDWGFQYKPVKGHIFDISEGVDIAITHGPPLGILDRTHNRVRAGSSDLFKAVAHAKTKIYCFGHIHEGWGAKLVSWRPELSASPSHITDIDNGSSIVVETLVTLHPSRFDTPEDTKLKQEKAKLPAYRKCCGFTYDTSINGAAISAKTLFVNAAIKGDSEGETHHPWLIEMDLAPST
jgi:Icc-related predicted phosphoesterase